MAPSPASSCGGSSLPRPALHCCTAPYPSHPARLCLLHQTSSSPAPQVFVVGPRFKGVKMVPPGVHFLSYQAAGCDGRVSPAVSTFLMLQPHDVVVRRWDAALEGLAPFEDEAEVGLVDCGPGWQPGAGAPKPARGHLHAAHYNLCVLNPSLPMTLAVRRPSATLRAFGDSTLTRALRPTTWRRAGHGVA
jgi:hypothetical protein